MATINRSIPEGTDSSALELTAGTYRVTASASGYEPVTEEVEVSDDVASLELALQKTDVGGGMLAEDAVWTGYPAGHGALRFVVEPAAVDRVVTVELASQADANNPTS